MESFASKLAAAQRLGAILFCIGLVVVGTSLFLAPAHAFPSYLIGFLFWMGITLGCFPILMIYYLVGGTWAIPIRKFLEAGISTLPLMGFLLIPLLFGFGYLYPWVEATGSGTDRLIEHKALYLNLPAVLVRTCLFFGVWGTLAFLLLRWSRRQAVTPGPAAALILRKVSAPGLIAFGLATSFAVVDWVMSLEPDWYSSIFPLIIITGQILSSLALGIVLSRALSFGAEKPTPEQLNQLGDLLLAFVMLWAYMSFSQIIIIYAGNLPHEVNWYLHRMRGGWLSLSWIIALFAFGVPFVLLLFRQLKRAPAWLCGIAGSLIMMHAVCVFWYVAPTFRPSISLDWSDPLAFCGIGGAWVMVFSHRLAHNLRMTPPGEQLA